MGARTRLLLQTEVNGEDVISRFTIGLPQTPWFILEC